MSFKHTLEILTKDIQDIEKLVSNFQNYSRIPPIEIDLALSKLQNLYELLLLLKDTEGNSPLAGKELKAEEATVAPNSSEEKNTAPPAQPAPEKTETVMSTAEALTDIQESEAMHPEPNPGVQASPDTKKRKEKIIGESFETKKLFVNESLGKKAESDPAVSRFTGGPIKNIAGSIGINDKFLFIRELFAGDADRFRSCLEVLDESVNFNEAYDYLLTHFDWDMDSEVVQQLLALVRRRFISTGNV
jgi:hypothetical protein